MRKILLGFLLLSVLCTAACQKNAPVAQPETNTEAEAFLRGENPELMELLNGEE